MVCAAVVRNVIEATSANITFCIRIKSGKMRVGGGKKIHIEGENTLVNIIENTRVRDENIITSGQPIIQIKHENMVAVAELA